MFYQFVETVFTVEENISSIQILVELAPSSGQLLNDVTLLVSRAGGSAMGKRFILTTAVYNDILQAMQEAIALL